MTAVVSFSSAFPVDLSLVAEVCNEAVRVVVLSLVERGEEGEVVPVSVVLVAHVVAHSVRKERQYNYVGLETVCIGLAKK